MLIENSSKYLLKKTRAKSKMFEYDVPIDEHISVESNAIELLLIAIGVMGNTSNELWNLEDAPLRVSEDSKKELEFSSVFFDALFQSKIEQNNRDYYILLGAIAYYFCDKVGSSIVLASEIDNTIDFDSASIDRVILAMLSDKMADLNLDSLNEKYKNELSEIIYAYDSYFGGNIEIDFSTFNSFKNRLHSEGAPRELLLGDALLAIFKKKISNSALNLMPQFSNFDKDVWAERLIHQTKLKELWTAQLRFGEFGIFKGRSGVVQMPTSSGKTTSVALTIQSAFLSNRAETAIIIAPFRALCKEIRFDLEKYFENESDIVINEFSDIPDKNDLFNVFDLGIDNQKQIAILTPEKLIYLLHHDKTILEKMGLIIFDEAHLFDDASRGANYELLLSTIKYYIGQSEKEIQKILISAVIPNAEKINDWINGENGVVIADNTIKSAEKTIAFSDWIGEKGTLFFVNPDNINEEEFYVPKIIEISTLNKLGRERKIKKFPDIDFNQKKFSAVDMGIYFSLKLNQNGGVAVFCGKKDSVNKTLQRFLEIEERGYDITSLQTRVKNNENVKVANLISKNYGEDNDYFKAAQKGIFAHHSGISNGIRMSVEYALKKDLVRCVICTSTLAQGVNLPIRYLVVSSVYQAGEQLKVRDFHNLIGRTGRAGKHTEGSVILTEPFIYSDRNLNSGWKWKNYSQLLNVNNSEECLSNLLRIVQPFSFYHRETKQKLLFSLNSLLIAKYSNDGNYTEIMTKYRNTFQNQYKDGSSEFEKAILILESSLKSVENYILDFHFSQNELDMENILVQTFGYYLANSDEKEKIKEIFTLIKQYLDLNVSSQDIETFSKSQLGIFQSTKLKKWVKDNFEILSDSEDDTVILKLIIGQMIDYSDNKVLKKIISKSEISNLAIQWINGGSYQSIYQYCLENQVQIQDKRTRAKYRTIRLIEVIELCDNDFGYSSILVVHAISEFMLALSPSNESIQELTNFLCQKLRYGLSNKTEILIYELGFSDRVIAEKISKKIGHVNYPSKNKVREIIRLKKEELKEVLENFPAYFIERLEKI